MKRLTFRKTSGAGPAQITAELDRAPMEMDDPVLSAGSAHSATASFPVTPAGIACSAELFLSLDGVIKAATSGPAVFTSTGVVQAVSLPVTMPSPAVGQSYRVLLNIVTGGVVIGAYEATDRVIVPVVGTPSIIWG